MAEYTFLQALVCGDGVPSDPCSSNGLMEMRAWVIDRLGFDISHITLFFRSCARLELVLDHRRDDEPRE